MKQKMKPISCREQSSFWGGYGSMTLSLSGQSFIKSYEGFSLTPYDDNGEESGGFISYNSGEIIGKIEITPKGNGVFKIKNDQFGMNCILIFSFQGNTVIVKTDAKACNCGFGNVVTADGEYKRTDTKIPRFFIDRHGDTIYFINLIHEF